MTRTWMLRAGAPVLALLLLGACGDDDESSADATTTTEADDGASGDVDAEFADLCAVAEEMNNQEDFPSAAQIQEYQAAAPDELQDAVTVAGAPFVEHEGDPVALFAAFADDDVSEAIGELNAFESEHCGIDHSEEEGLTEEVAVDESANRVDVTAVDYSFQFAPEVPAGATSLVLTNEGNEAHFMVVIRLLDGHTLEEALAFEGDPEEAGMAETVGESGLAAPGGDDEEVLNADLDAGNYAMLCFVSGADGTPHAFQGMAVPFTVS